MVSFKSNAKNYRDAESMATAYLVAYFGNSKIEYPLTPFKMLKDEGVDFVIRNFNKLEGVYIPAQLPDDVAIVGINARRPITRQPFDTFHSGELSDGSINDFRYGCRFSMQSTFYTPHKQRLAHFLHPVMVIARKKQESKHGVFLR